VTFDVKDFSGRTVATIPDPSEVTFEIEESISVELFLSITGYSRGLCSERDRHEGHVHESATLGVFFCTGDPDDREPMRSERRRQSS
jgi:hypothetical protein